MNDVWEKYFPNDSGYVRELKAEIVALKYELDGRNKKSEEDSKRVKIEAIKDFISMIRDKVAGNMTQTVDRDVVFDLIDICADSYIKRIGNGDV